MTPNSDPGRRLRPRVWDTDWLVLRELSRSLGSLIGTKVRPGDVVLDFGCGSMPYRSLVENAGASYLGADFGADGAVRIGPDGRLPLPDGSVDVVISVQVLEHVRDLDTYFAEIARVLKRDGVLILSTHGTWLYHPHPEDHRRWTRTGLTHDIETRGFAVEAITSIVGPLATTTLIRLAGYAYILRRLPVVGRGTAALLTATMNIRGWLEDRITPASIREDNGCVYLTRCAKAAA